MNRMLFSFVILLLVMPVRAETDAATEDEKRYLIEITKEIAHVRELAAKAQAASDVHARVALDYGALLSDLSDMKQSIENHINRPSRSPRIVKPLQGEYETNVKKENE